MIQQVSPKPAAVVSPCTGVCTLDPVSDWCLGCGRTIDEIADWSTMTAAARTAVLALLAGRIELRERDVKHADTTTRRR